MVLFYALTMAYFLSCSVLGTVCSSLGVRQCLVLMADSSSYIFLLTLTSISVTVLTWSYFYIDSDSVYRRFLMLIFLFLGSIFILVFSADLLCLFVAWDLLGFTSFFLVIINRSRSSLGGGLLTGLTNRLGDVFLLSFFGLVFYGSSDSLSWPLWILVVISCTKSAQVPFSAWLPAAMLAPTPVSALVHSSTLVTAGVYLLYRYAPSSCSFLIYVGILTTLVAGFAALLECDIKKVIALSTLSQLGLIVSSLGVGERALCFAHLNTHAAFKALLFLAVGTVIHSIYGSQEPRSLVSLASSSPFLIIVVLVGSLSICGLVFLSGIVTKEAILEACFSRGIRLSSLLLFYLGIILTLAYRLQLVRRLLCSTNSSVPLSLSISGSLLVKLPMCWLLFVSIAQGCCFYLNSATRFPVLCLLDKLLI